MGNSPILLAGIIRREKTIMGTISDLFQACCDNFAKTVFIADFIDELVGADEYTWLTEDP